MRWLIAVFILVGCRAAPQQSTLNEIAREELGDHFSMELNTSKTFALAWTPNKENTSYIVVQLSTKKVILAKTNIHATVTWNNDTQIKEISKPGMIKKEGNTGNGIRLINVNDYLQNSK